MAVANDVTAAAIAAATARSTTNTGAISLAQHTPSLAGSVLECADGFGGTLLIRLQNMSATGKAFCRRFSPCIAFVGIIIIIVQYSLPSLSVRHLFSFNIFALPLPPKPYQSKPTSACGWI